MTGRPRILVLIGSLWPGNDSSGPNLSIRAQCEALCDDFDFSLVARDRPFAGGPALARAGECHELGYARAAYLPVGRTGAQGLARLLRETPHDLLVLNGFFDREFTLPALALRRLGMVPRRPTLLSPRGEFTTGALSLKRLPKLLLRRVAPLLGLHRGVAFHVTSDAELADVRAALPGKDVTLVPNFRPLFPAPPHVPRPDGAPLRLAFLGRISPVKGLDTALAAMATAGVPAQLDIYGPIGDAAHWDHCRQIISQLPAGCSATWHGEIANADAAAMLAAHDALLLPSLSENFGHAIFEALAAGTPVIIGDQTPWRGLEADWAGFELPAGDVTAFADAVRRLAAQQGKERAAWRAGARARAEHFCASNQAAEDMTALFRRLIEQRSA
jgi:glycosyltransferase involved in cell wall biosynthesis